MLRIASRFAAPTMDHACTGIQPATAAGELLRHDDFHTVGAPRTALISVSPSQALLEPTRGAQKPGDALQQVLREHRTSSPPEFAVEPLRRTRPSIHPLGEPLTSFLFCLR